MNDIAEELQRLEDEDEEATQRLHEIQAKEFSSLQESEELVRLEDLQRIAQEDELLAQALMAQEQAEFEQEQDERLEQEEEERRERERRENLGGVGAPVAVRCVNSWGKITEASINELTPEVVKHLKHVKETFAKSISEMKITKLEWIVNLRLEAQFEHTRTQLKAAKHSTKEILLFHGTEAGNINKYLTPTCW
jgi:hypothetical protein